MHIRTAIWLFCLWFVFLIGCVCAPLLVLGYPLLHHNRQYRHFILAADRLVATMLGFSGRLTISAEVAASDKFHWLREKLNQIEPGHCESSAYSEGAYCRLKDHELGAK